jgi:hypothetical protein
LFLLHMSVILFFKRLNIVGFSVRCLCLQHITINLF